jgi:hypothetical protein
MDKTHYKKLRNPHYIGSYELMTGGEPKNIVVEIVSAVKEIVQNGDKKEDAMVLHLKNQKPMIINSTNAKSIAKALGSPYIEDWNGKRIELCVKKIKAFGDWHDALRVVDVAPKEAGKPDFNPKHERWFGALVALAEKKTTISEIQKTFTINDENLKLLQDAVK